MKGPESSASERRAHVAMLEVEARRPLGGVAVDGRATTLAPSARVGKTEDTGLER
jgi:hypothetical protein